MCFSTEASFSAAVLLGAIGSATLKINHSKHFFLLAAIPLLFSIQQLSEGLIWLNIEKNVFSANTALVAQNLYLFFAFLVWPILIPLSLGIPEKIQWRRNIIFAVLGCGIVLSLVNLSYGLDQNFVVKVVNQSLQYFGRIPDQHIIYPLIILIPCFISSLKYIQWFGALIALAYFIADYSYSVNFVSVWCFFSAIVSITIYKIIRENQVTFVNGKENIKS